MVLNGVSTDDGLQPMVKLLGVYVIRRVVFVFSRFTTRAVLHAFASQPQN